MPTRTIFLHISPAQQVLFYLLAALSVGIAVRPLFVRAKRWRLGRPSAPMAPLRERLAQVASQGLGHSRIRRRRAVGAAHAAIFYGMLALFTGTCIVAAEHYGGIVLGAGWLYRGGFYLLTKATLDLFGAALALGTAYVLARRTLFRPSVVGHSPFDTGFLLLLLSATLTGFLLEGAGIAADPARRPFAAYSPVGGIFAQSLTGVSVASYQSIWWLHGVLVLSLIAVLPHGRRMHILLAPLAIATQPARRMGALESVSVEEVEATGRIGLSSVGDLDRWTLMSLDACMECGRCTAVCPANAAGKPLDPKAVVMGLRDMPAGAESATDIVSDEALWACTNCHACVDACPAAIRHVDLIDGIRRYRVGTGRLAGTGAAALRQLASRDNPWGMPASQRGDWTKGLAIPLASKDDQCDVLFWVGCAGAFEPSAQAAVRATAQLMTMAGVKFSILGPRERCSGDPARRIGDEFLFMQMAEANIAELGKLGPRKIVTQCPHCLHTLQNEYPQFGGDFEVKHHSVFLNDLVEAGRLKVKSALADTVTYHDPCFLARVNGQIEAPRALLGASVGTPIVEPDLHGKNTFCCGAGGGRMWMEDAPTQRPGLIRAHQLLEKQTSVVAVGCPFCKVMVTDSVTSLAGTEAPQVLDVAEILLRAVDPNNDVAGQ